MAREEEMPERIQDLAEFDDISPIVGKMLPPPSRAKEAAAFMIDWGDGEGGRGGLRRRRRNSFRSAAPDYGA